MQPPSNSPPRHADVIRTTLFMDVLPDLSGFSEGSGISRRRQYATLQQRHFVTCGDWAGSPAPGKSRLNWGFVSESLRVSLRLRGLNRCVAISSRRSAEN